MKTDEEMTTRTRGPRFDPTGQTHGEAPFAQQRHIATRVLAVIGLAAFALSVVIVVSDILNPVANEAAFVPAGSPEAQIGADRPAETVHVVGAMTALFVGGSGMAALALQPQRLGSANHTIVAMLASVIAMGVTGNPDNHGGQAGPFDPAFLIFAVPGMVAALAARPWASWRRHYLARPRFLALAAAGVPFLWYGTHQALLQRNTWPPLADPHHQAHWYLMAVLAFMIVTVTASAAITVRGWRLAAVTAALSAIALGATSLVAPAAASSLPPLWAALAIAWGGGGLALTWTTRTNGTSAASAHWPTTGGSRVSRLGHPKATAPPRCSTPPPRQSVEPSTTPSGPRRAQWVQWVQRWARCSRVGPWRPARSQRQPAVRYKRLMSL